MMMANGSRFEDFPEYQVAGIREHHFNPYESNGGYVLIFCFHSFGRSYAVSSIFSRLYTKITNKNSKMFFSGFRRIDRL